MAHIPSELSATYGVLERLSKSIGDDSSLTLSESRSAAILELEALRSKLMVDMEALASSKGLDDVALEQELFKAKDALLKLTQHSGDASSVFKARRE